MFAVADAIFTSQMDGKFTQFCDSMITSSSENAMTRIEVKTPVYVIIWRDYIEKNVVLFQARGYADSVRYYFVLEVLGKYRIELNHPRIYAAPWNNSVKADRGISVANFVACR